MTNVDTVGSVITGPITKEQFLYGVALYAVRDQHGGFWSCAPELPGVMSQGVTAKEALANVEEALREAVQSYLDDGVAIPWGSPLVPREFLQASSDDRAEGCAIIDLRRR